MKKSDWNRFQRILETNLVELGSSVRRRETIAIETSADDLDRILRAAERELAVQSLEAVSTKLRDVRAALVRMEKGTFGECLECGEAISPARLAAIPWAPLCIHCQEDADGSRGRETTRFPRHQHSYPIAA